VSYHFRRGCINAKTLILRTLGLLTGVLLFAGARYAADTPTANVSAFGQVASSLAALAVRVCPSNCEFGGCTDFEHDNWNQSGGNDAGEEHDCAWSFEGCGDHRCNGLAALGIPNFDLLLPSLRGSELRALETKYAHLRVNADRRAIQVFGCDKQVVLTLNLSPQQLAELGS